MNYNHYDKTMESKLKWIGRIPSHWKLSKFKHNFTFSKSTNTSKNPTILSLTLQGIKIRDITTNEGQIASSYVFWTDGDAESLCESLSSRCPPSMKNSSKPARDMGLQTGGQGGQQGQ